jgi:perosamine synthetase
MIPWASPVFWGNERAFVEEALASTWISGGPFVDRIEDEIARMCGKPRAVSASNGTTALHMIYLALGIGPGDEVIVPGFAFQAAANVAIHVGARPVFAEVDPHTWCMTAAAVERCITNRTKLIVAVHTYGNVCDTDEICALGEQRGIMVVEDAAESFASRDRGRLSGTIASIGCFSFQATKTITTGEGGLVITDNEDHYQRMRLYRNHGMDRLRYWHELAGHNFRLTNLQAALGCAQLEHLSTIVSERKRVQEHYVRRLTGIAGITMQHFHEHVDPVVWAVAVKLDPDAFRQGRDAVIDELLQKGIETRPGFYAASLMDHLYKDCPSLPVCEDLSRQIISLPTFPTLTSEQIDYVCDTLDGART